jgi:hypothetical protein
MTFLPYAPLFAMGGWEVFWNKNQEDKIGVVAGVFSGDERSISSLLILPQSTD